MQRALDLAAKGRHDVPPNPMVGALVVRHGRILGQGWHARYGGIHAEEAALNDCREKGEDPAGADIYVTLEPCSFHAPDKHNGPCTEKILTAGIARVFIASVDPNPRVAGNGIRILKEKGLAVRSGILAEKEERLNEIYRTLQAEKRPFVELKAALTADGFLAARDGSSRWVSCDASRDRVMTLRRSCDAVLVGGGTLRADYPSLTIRDREGRITSEEQPKRVVLSRRAELPEGWPGEGGDVLLYGSSSSSEADIPAVVEKVSVSSGQEGLCLEEVLQDLYRRGVRRLLVEGGRQVFRSFLRGGGWDRLTLFQAPDLLGTGVPFAGDLGISSMGDKIILAHRIREFSGRDLMIRGYRSAYPSEEGPCSQD